MAGQSTNIGDSLHSSVAMADEAMAATDQGTAQDLAYLDKDALLAPRQMARIDMHILPTLTVIYIMSFLDRINISNALVYGLPRDLHLVGTQTNTAIAVLFVSYVLFEIPGTVVMKRIGPPIFLPVSMFLFGLFMLLQGFVQNFAGLVALRVLMGIAEAGTYPACYYLISMWYRRAAAQRRFTFFFSGAAFAAAFGSLLASAIGKMDGVGGHAAWRWIFILEGILTCLLSVGCWLTISDFPEKAKWLNESERASIIESLRSDQGSSRFDERLTLADAVLILKDWKIFWSAPLYFSVSVSTYGLAFFLPSIVSTFGYSPINTQLFSVIPWAIALVVSLIMAYASDRMHLRAPFIIFGFALALAGNLILFTIHNNRPTQFAGVVLYLVGPVSVVPIAVCWVAMNLTGHRERAISIPWQVGLGNASGIIGVFAFPESSAPEYRLGYALGLGFLCAFALVVGICIVGFLVGNRRHSGTVQYVL